MDLFFYFARAGIVIGLYLGCSYFYLKDYMESTSKITLLDLLFITSLGWIIGLFITMSYIVKGIALLDNVVIWRKHS